MSDIAGSSSDGRVDQLLRDAGFDDDAVLRDALQDLRGLAASEQLEPSAAVAALMVPAPTRHLTAVPAPATEGFLAQRADNLAQRAENGAQTLNAAPAAVAPPVDQLAARRRAKRRITLTTLSVAVSLAAGGAVAVASDQGLRESIGHVNQAVTSFVTTVAGGHEPAAPAVPAPPPAGQLPPATVPTGPATLPAPAVTQQVPAAPRSHAGSNSGPTPAKSPGQPDPAKEAPLEHLPVPQNLTPALPKVPDRLPDGEGQPPALPLPPTPPVRLPHIQP